jgi:hypothetical protein
LVADNLIAERSVKYGHLVMMPDGHAQEDFSTITPVRFWLEKPRHSGQGDGRFARTLTRRANPSPRRHWNADDRYSSQNH